MRLFPTTINTLIDFGPVPRGTVTRFIGSQLTSTNNLNLPINCVLDGQQPEEKKFPKFVTDPYGILKKIIFGE